MEDLDYDSSLGQEPVCDTCKKTILAGDYVTQTFTGTVKPISDNEMAIADSAFSKVIYTLVHVNCFNRSSF